MDNALLLEYDQVITGHRSNIPQTYFSYSTSVNQDQALTVFKYAFENYLRWNPYEVRDFLTYGVLDKLRLTPLLKYIDFPTEVDEEKDLFYISWLLYPETIHMSQKDLILRMFKKVLSGEAKKYPKEFFTGTPGEVRASLCLRYVLEHNFQFESVADMYSMFASPKIRTVLNEYKLGIVCRDLFESPLDFLHATLSDNQKDEFLLHYNKFLCARKQVKRMKNKENKNKLLQSDNMFDEEAEIMEDE